MNSHDLIRLLVLAEISDDYEEPEHVYKEVAERANLCGISIKPREVRAILVDLVRSGLAKAYKLSTTAPAAEIEGLPPLGQLDEYYFWITKKGEDEIDSSRGGGWPFDDEGMLRPGWTPSE